MLPSFQPTASLASYASDFGLALFAQSNDNDNQQSESLDLNSTIIESIMEHDVGNEGEHQTIADLIPTNSSSPSLTWSSLKGQLQNPEVPIVNKLEFDNFLQSLDDLFLSEDERRKELEKKALQEKAERDPNGQRSIQDLVEAAGYTFDAHSVVTEDGYILEVHHVKANSTAVGSPVVFLQHGVLASSESFVLLGSDSAAFRLADKGYDVWMGNSRGNVYSRKHETLNPDDDNDHSAYFDFSFFEMAKYDLPAQVDYVLNQTGRETLTYIAHSQGTSQMFTALAEGFGGIPQKINKFIALAPITKLAGSESLLMKAFGSSSLPLITELLEKLQIQELFGPKFLELKDEVCPNAADVCKLQVQDVPLNEYTNHYYAMVANKRQTNLNSASLKQIVHFAQIKVNDRFAQYEFDSMDENEKKYGAEFRDQAPSIDLSQIKQNVGNHTFSISMFVGLDDSLSMPVNAQWAKDTIGDEIVTSYQELPHFAHESFNFGNDMSYFDTVISQVEEVYKPTEIELTQ